MGFPGATDVLQRCDPGASLGGHRLVARLSRGRRSTSYLTMSEDDQPGLLRVFHGLAGRDVLVQTLTAAGGLRHGGPLPRLSEDGGEVFALDELLIGESLASALQRIVDADMPMPPAVAVSIALAVIARLRQAEGCHGDLVPAHILLGFEGEVWVIDPPGLEASARRALPSRASYLPPELGMAAPPTSSSDLYQLAGALFEALTARALTPDAAPADINHIPPALHRALHRMLRTRPEARFADLAEAAEALQVCLDDTPLGPEVIAAWTRTFFADRLGRWRGFVQLGSQRPSEAQRMVTQIDPVETLDALAPLEPIGDPTSVTSADLTDEGLLPERTPHASASGLNDLSPDPQSNAPLLGHIEGEDVPTALLHPAAWDNPDLDVTHDAGPDWQAAAPFPAQPSVHTPSEAPEGGLFRPLSVAGGDWSTVPWSALLAEPTRDDMPAVTALIPSQTPTDELPPVSSTPMTSFSPSPSASADMSVEPELPHSVVGRGSEWETLQGPEDVIHVRPPSVEEVTQARPPPTEEEVTQARTPPSRTSVDGGQALLSPPATVSSPALPGAATIDGDFAQAHIETQVVRLRRPPEQLRLDRRPPPRLDSLQLDISVTAEEPPLADAPLDELGPPLSPPLAFEPTAQLPLSKTDPVATGAIDPQLPDRPASDPPTLPASVSTFEIEELPTAAAPSRALRALLVVLVLLALVAGGWAAFEAGYLTPLLDELGLG